MSELVLCGLCRSQIPVTEPIENRQLLECLGYQARYGCGAYLMMTRSGQFTTQHLICAGPQMLKAGRK